MRLSSVLLALCVLLAACGQQPERSSQPEGFDGARLTTEFSLTDDRLRVAFTLHNTGEKPLVAFDRGWVADPDAPTEDELESKADDVQVIAGDEVVEFGLRIIHGCHGNPQGERSPDTDGESTDCDADAPVSQRIAATRVEPGDKLTREYDFDAASVWIDFPTAKARTTIDVAGQQVELCLGVARPTKLADDDLYPPDTDETVLCGDVTTVD